MEEQKKREEYEELTKERITEKESLKKRKTLERQLNKERKQRKGKWRENGEINGQNMRGKTKESLHARHILIVHVALSKSNINSS